MTSQIKPQNQNNNSTATKPSFAVRLIASALYSGYSPIASGTVGSIVAIAIYLIPGFESPRVLGIITVIAFILGLKTAGTMERYYGHDPAEVTIDEVVGMWISLFLLPKTFWVIIVAFFLFRLFDIIKPYPARKFDNMQGSIGIMMDDVIAAVYANILIQLSLLIPPLKDFLLKF